MPPKSASPTIKPRLNVYTMMLFISLVAIITACVLLWQVQNRYGGLTPSAWDTTEARRGLSYDSAPSHAQPLLASPTRLV